MTTLLSQSELRYRRLFESAHDGILIVDPETRKIIDVNPFLEKFLGYTHAEFIGKELFEFGLLKDEAASQAAFEELRLKKFIRYEDLPLKTKAGSQVDVEYVSNLYQEGDSQVIQCNIRDISVRKKNETTLREAEAKLAQHALGLEGLVTQRTSDLQHLNAQLETFVYSIAHDLRGPLRTMQGFSDLLLQEHSDKLDQQGIDYTHFINTAAQTMDRLLSDLLDFSRISQQKITLVPMNLGPVVQSAIVQCDGVIRIGQAEILTESAWPMVVAHESTLIQVIVNLLSNAIKFVAGRTPTIKIRTEPRPSEMVRLWVEDNGIGIPLEFQERIFQVFQRLHNTAYGGTGIGLAIVQKGIERMGGRVGLISVPNKGSKFWIDLCTPSRRSNYIS